eukprot:CAMPEP_0194210708 /NCGR_PEP_ID=MMETSP0156-20130528/8990_1 /TAXON_ID=33649 /ORGANISM="Thalassionema nitzschioides, Strain L26-B" /LENGTH=625 /DNA_ID=CAMNT_0038938087 /DNA_START=10 /DNA_END=1887 /DNA_ORIENTATION=+
MPPIAEGFFGGVAAETGADMSVLVPTPKADSTEFTEALFTPRTRECDFDKAPTQVYLLLQKKDWDGAIARSGTNPEEARTWVSRKEFDGKLRWRLLPLHAAIIFKAPENVIEALLGAYPKGAESKDDQGMLPLHLAFRNGSTEGVVNLLLVAYPQSIDVKDRKGRIPLVLAQASTSPNRDAFMRSLERGPTYYAVAAAATERAAVTSELRAIFDAKLIEIKNQHENEMQALRSDTIQEKKMLEDRVVDLETELNKTQETSQVLVDHVNSLEAQLTTRGDTERFLATKIATLDTSLKDKTKEKEETEGMLAQENAVLKSTNAELADKVARFESDLDALRAELEAANGEKAELGDNLNVTQEKSVEEIQRLESEWAQAKANSAVLEAQLKKKVETEHSLASQVSTLASKLAENAADTAQNNNSYSEKMDRIVSERKDLRNTVAELTKKLRIVSEEVESVSKGQSNIIKSAAKHEALMGEAAKAQAEILANANAHELIVEQVNEERRQILEILVNQEREILESAEERVRIRDSISAQDEQSAHTTLERHNLMMMINEQKEKMNQLRESQLNVLPRESEKNLSEEDLVNEVVRMTVESLAENGPTEVSYGGEEEDEDYDPVVGSRAADI